MKPVRILPGDSILRNFKCVFSLNINNYERTVSVIITKPEFCFAVRVEIGLSLIKKKIVGVVGSEIIQLILFIYLFSDLRYVIFGYQTAIIPFKQNISL